MRSGWSSSLSHLQWLKAPPSKVHPRPLWTRRRHRTIPCPETPCSQCPACSATRGMPPFQEDALSHLRSPARTSCQPWPLSLTSEHPYPCTGLCSQRSFRCGVHVEVQTRKEAYRLPCTPQGPLKSCSRRLGLSLHPKQDLCLIDTYALPSIPLWKYMMQLHPLLLDRSLGPETVHTGNA